MLSAGIFAHLIAGLSDEEDAVQKECIEGLLALKDFFAAHALELTNSIKPLVKIIR